MRAREGQYLAVLHSPYVSIVLVQVLAFGLTIHFDITQFRAFMGR